MPEKEFYGRCFQCSAIRHANLHWKLNKDDGKPEIDLQSPLYKKFMIHHKRHNGHNQIILFDTQEQASQQLEDQNEHLIIQNIQHMEGILTISRENFPLILFLPEIA